MRRWIIALAAAVLATAVAQTQFEFFTSASMEYRIGYPGGWVVQASHDHTSLDIQPPETSPQHGQAAIYLAVEPAYEGTLEQGIEETLAIMSAGLAGARILDRSPATISGRPAATVDMRGTIAGIDITYRMAFVLDGPRGFVLMLAVLTEQAAAYASLFDLVVDSFALTGAEVSPPLPSPTPSVGYAGTFVGDGVTLTLEVVLAGVHYAGTLQHGGASYPITAQVTSTGLAGAFESAGHRFEFSAVLSDDVLTFVTGAATFTLRRHGVTPEPEPCNPLVPGSCDRSPLPPPDPEGLTPLPPPDPEGITPLPPPVDARRAAVAVEVPNPCLLLSLLPGAAVAGPPPGVTVGTRLVYYTAAASIPGERTQLVQDEHGNWVDRATGQRFGEQDVPGPAGAGYLVAQVGYLDTQRVVVSQRRYLIDGASGQALWDWEGTSGTVSHAGCAGDYWVHPQALAALPDMDQVGTRVLRMPYRLGERVFDAIRIHTTTAAGFAAHVYDLESGFLLYFGSRTVGPEVLTPQPGGAVPGRGSTQLVNGWLLEVQHVDVPWREAPTPAWVAQFQQLEYQGTFTAVVPGSPAVPIPIHERVSTVHRGHDWLQVVTDATMYSLAGMLVGHHQALTSHGPATIGGLWIAPQALARLTQGQLIERCEVVGITTTVSSVTAETVTLSEAGPLHRNDLVYDLRTGILLRNTRTQQLGGNPHVLELQLVSGPH